MRLSRTDAYSLDVMHDGVPTIIFAGNHGSANRAFTFRFGGGIVSANFAIQNGTSGAAIDDW
jgi:hypothetical protein